MGKSMMFSNAAQALECTTETLLRIEQEDLKQKLDWILNRDRLRVSVAEVTK